MKYSILTITFVLYIIDSVQSQEPYFYLYSQTNTNNYYNILSIGDSNSLKYLNPSKNYIFLIHGFNSHVNKSYWQSYKDTVLRKVYILFI